MVYNAMYPIKQNPYYAKDNRNFVKKKEDEESSQSARNSEEKQDEVLINQNRKNELQQELKESKQAQANAITSRDANIKNSSVNIAQIIKDFKNTAAAIGTPDDLNEEVNAYLSLVEAQVVKDEPNVKLVKSNLKNASSLLDGYITETLQRPSKVVENWLDALFLQQINFKFNQEEINPQFLVKFPEKAQAAIEQAEAEEADTVKNTEETTPTNQTTKAEIIVPQDEQLKSLFIQAKKYSYANDSKKAMETFQAALNRSVEVNDKETQSKILYEIGKIYDSNDYLSQALTSYNKSLATTQDTNIKTKAHFSMAQIYDDVAEFEPAINHYMSSISYAGENENLVAQSTSLTKIGNIYSDKYSRDAFDFYSEAKLIAKESKDTKAKGYVSSNTANAYSKFNEPQNALKYYSDAVKEYKEADSPLKMASNYKKAADVMANYGNSQKAKSLLEKALVNAKQAQNAELIAEINVQLQSL